MLFGASLVLGVIGIPLVLQASPATAYSSTWTPTSVPAPEGGSDAYLQSVSCASAGNCSAVGAYKTSSGYFQGLLLLNEVSGTWGTGTEAVLPAGDYSNLALGLDSVSCASAGNCSAVGGTHGSGLLVDEVSGTWQPVAFTGGGVDGGVLVDSVSCSSAGNCGAVGGAAAAGFYAGLLLNEVDGTWGTVTWTGDPLDSVSCSSAGNCSAVGDGGLLVDEVSGTWQTSTEAALPPNAASYDANLASVSCASAGNCSAVGNYVDSSSNAHGFLLEEVSGTWQTGIEALLPTDAAGTAASNLTSVSCYSAGNCSAVGTYTDSSGNTQGLLLDEVDGTWGSGTSVPLPAGAASNPSLHLNSVSCAQDGICSAVGTYTDSSGNTQGLLLDEVGGTWQSGTEAPLPGDAASNPKVDLSSVSCASGSKCSAVGSYDEGTTTDGLVETLNLTRSVS
jgi:hypothetical protein